MDLSLTGAGREQRKPGAPFPCSYPVEELLCRSLPLAADVAFFECAGVPLVILGVRCAIPLTAVFAARARWSAAGLIQMRLRLACRRRALAGFLSRGLWMHGAPHGADSTLVGQRWRQTPSCDRYPVIPPSALKGDDRGAPALVTAAAEENAWPRDARRLPDRFRLVV
jgi:hypothetical protein